MYRNHALYLREWIEFHRLVGVERFFLYDNGSEDEHLDALRPYTEEGVAVVHDWPLPFVGVRGRPGALMLGFDHCLEEHRGDSRWIGFVDIDEFLFSPTGTPLSELLPRYESVPGVLAGRAEFGTSGHVTRPEGLLIENYLQRVVRSPDDRVYHKSIVDPGRTSWCLGPHDFAYEGGAAVDERGNPVDDRGVTSCELLRVNHYGLSEEETSRKRATWRKAGDVAVRERQSFVITGDAVDTAITQYVPALREALRAVNDRHPFEPAP
jgi:hypothetical protein